MAEPTLLVIDDSPTVLRVVESTLVKAGYRVLAASEAQEAVALAREQRPDLVLVDFLFPQGDNAEFFASLRREAGLGEVPVVVMSGRGDEVSRRMGEIPHVVDAITKPFSPEALLAVVSHALGKPPTLDAAGAGQALFPGQLRDQATGEVPVGAILRSAQAPAEHLPQGEGGDLPDLMGSLAVVPAGDVLVFIRDQTLTGLLRVQKDPARVEIFFADGRVDYALAQGVPEEFLLGRYLVHSGAVAPELLEEVLADRSRAKAPPLLGEDLLARGLLEEADLRRAMYRQTAELVFEVLRWSTGRFQFQVLPPASQAPHRAALDIPVDQLLLEGFRRVDDWRVIEKVIESFDLVFVREDEKIATLRRGTLTRDEASVLDLVNGKNSVRDIIRLSRMGAFDAAKMLYRLLKIRLIRRRVGPVAVS